jgi:hypothetical protein
MAQFSELVATLMSKKAHPSRVKIGILSSGIDLGFLSKTEQISNTRSFVTGEGIEDRDGAGTRAASLLLRLAPYAGLCVAKVLSTTSTGIKALVVAAVGSTFPRLR